MRLFRVLTLLFAAGMLSAVTAGCGGGDAKGGDKKSSKKKSGKKKGSNKKTAKKPAKKKTPAPANVGGADSPADLVKRMKAAVDKEDLGAAIMLYDPDERRGMIAMFGYFPVAMKAMKKEFPAEVERKYQEMLKESGEAAAKMFKAQMEGMGKMMIEMLGKLAAPMEEICTKHKIKLPSLEKIGMSAEEVMKMDGSPAELGKKVGTAVDGIDVSAFMKDMMAAVKKMSEQMPGGGGSPDPFEDIKARFGDGKLTELKLDGDSATGKVDGEPQTFKKIGGRWYATDISGMTGERKGVTGDDDDEDEDWGEDEEDEGSEDEDDGGMGGG